MILFPHHKSRLSSPYSSAEKGEERLLSSAEQPPEVSLESSPCSPRKPSFFWHSLKGAFLFCCFLLLCSLLPMQVLAVTPQIAAGPYHTVALKSDGTVVAWGLNDKGQTTIPTGLAGVMAIATGNAHTVVLKNDGTVVAWGNNLYGQTTIPAGLTGVTAIAAGDTHTVALKNDGTLVAWGDNSVGQTTIPVGLTGVTAIAAGGLYTVALKSDGTLVAWGYNDLGQTTIPAGLAGVTAIAAGWRYTVALKNDGTLVAWGENSFGQTTIPAGLAGVTAIAAGWSHTVALKSDGTLVAWGDNSWGKTTILAGLAGVTAIATGNAHTVALKNDGTVVAWGYNGLGQATTIPIGLNLLAGTTTNQPTATTPAPILGTSLGSLTSLGIETSPSSSLIRIMFHAVDSYSGLSLPSLKTVDFSVLENGIQITSGSEQYFSILRRNELPFRNETILMLDVSASVSSSLALIKQAAKDIFLDPYGNSLLLDEQVVAIYVFDRQVRKIQDFTSNARQLSAAIDSILKSNTTFNSTNLYGAIVTSHKVQVNFLISCLEYRHVQLSA